MFLLQEISILTFSEIKNTFLKHSSMQGIGGGLVFRHQEILILAFSENVNLY